MSRRPPVTGTLDWGQVLRWRVHRQLLTEPTTNPTRVAERLLGVHAQLASSATTAIRLRSRQRPPRTASLVKTWTARGTLHLLPESALPSWVAVMSTRNRHEKPSWLKYFRVTAEGMAAMLAAIPDALGGEPRTREELAERVVELTGREELRELLGGSWGTGLKPAAFRGLLVFGPPRGRNVTFVSPGPLPVVDVDDAVDTLLRGYLGTYGPADSDEFVRWLEAPNPLVRRAFNRLSEAGELTWVQAGEKPRAVLTSMRAEIEAAPDSGVHLLPAFDPYVVGSLPQLPEIVAGDQRAVSRPQGWISPVLVVDGRIVGTWQPADGITAFTPLKPARRRSVKPAAERLAEAAGDETLAQRLRLV